jgi:ferredoxin
MSSIENIGHKLCSSCRLCAVACPQKTIMAQKILPIGIQSFEGLRSNNYVYVDKTESVFRLINNGKIYFLSRPRRFGKSMLISTLDCLFSCKKHLFEGLYIYDKWNWEEPHPVIRIDWTQVGYNDTDSVRKNMFISVDQLNSGYSLEYLSEIPLLFQTGYLTVKSIDIPYDEPYYTIDVPNFEVSRALMDELIRVYYRETRGRIYR